MDDAPLVEGDDAVGEGECGAALGEEEDRALEVAEGGEDAGLGFAVKGPGDFVEDQDVGRSITMSLINFLTK